MIRTILAATVLLIAGALPSAAADDTICVQNGRHLVIAQPRADSVGTDFIIRAPALGKIKCEYEVRADDYLLDDPAEALWFEGLADDFLVMTRSTGPDIAVVIFDLVGKVDVVDVPADDALVISTDSVTYWERTEPGTAANCPEFAEYAANDLGAVISEEQVLDRSTGAVTRTGQTRCSPTQS